LFPVFAKVREKARQTVCLSNEKQIGLGLMQYVEDNDEVLPQANYGGNKAYFPKWMDSLYPYVKSTNVFDCPDNLPLALEYVPCGALRSDHTCSVRRGARFGTYGVNGAYFYGKTYHGSVPTHSPIGASIAAIQVPATTVFVTEAVYADVQYTNVSVSWDYDIHNPIVNKLTTPPTLQLSGYPLATTCVLSGPCLAPLSHTGGTNVLWCDGHAKWMTGDALVATHTINGQKVAYNFTVEDD
jgi:prepilin-type processing-associated H-X9-DG protein